ncbi:MAG: winged helix-turn-helix transcriptional regulator [Spirochaetales bacterium]|jgi:DNA-binding transcriptional ArsR family regulator|nr:winged helix-turn-helix transcriptional regulator [Spirochaetales bacterium]
MKLKWDIGAAYELFTSLFVIHNPSIFGVRPSWAAGVRSRIPADSRDIFTQSLPFLKSPLQWVHSLPEPKNGATVVGQLESINPEDVLSNIAPMCGPEDEIGLFFRGITGKGSWDEADICKFEKLVEPPAGKKHKINIDELSGWLNCWAHPVEFGTGFIRGISDYYESFFREEEKRIEPALQQGLADAQKKALSLSTEDLIEELSQGIKSDMLSDKETVVLMPSFWLGPLVMLADLGNEVGMMQFGSRPADASLIPGDVVPDSLSTGLQALSDHTRLKILKLIAKEPLTQVEIAKKLRLRAPTINHHLKILRLASLVTKTYPDDDPKHTRYSIRGGRVDELCSTIRTFLGSYVEPPAGTQ